MAYEGPHALPVPSGATGRSSLTNHSIIVGAATAAVTQLAVGATGTVLTGVTASDPAFSATPSLTQVTISGAVTNPTDTATKAYVDSVAAGFTFQPNALAASTGAYTATYANGAAGVGASLTNAAAMAAFSIDGVSPSVSDRVLIKNQASTFQNGIYTVTTVGSGAVNWVLTRATNYDETTEIKPGNLVPVTSGTVNANTIWLQTETVAAIGTDPILFVPFTNSGASTFNTDAGTANVSVNTITIHGGSNIGTTGAGSTVTIDLDNSPSVSGSLTAGTGVTATTGNITASSGNMSASGSITAGNGLIASAGGATITGTTGINLRAIAAGYTGSNWLTLQSSVQTANATPTVLVSVAVADSQMVTIKAYINGLRSTFASCIGAEVLLTVRRGAGGNVTLVSPPIVNTITDTSCDVTCTVDTGTQTARILVTGVAAQTFNWVSSYSYMLLNTNA